MDVLDPVHEKWNRADLMLPPRGCLVCGCKGKNCASRRLHSVAEIQQVTTNLLRNFFAEQDRCSLADLASRSLLYEVCTTCLLYTSKGRSGAHEVVGIPGVPVYIGHTDSTGTTIFVYHIKVSTAEIFICNDLLHCTQQNVMSATSSIAGN